MNITEFIHTQSLTAILCKCEQHKFTVRPTFSDITSILNEERKFFANIDNIFAREVLLCLDDIPVVAARSICLIDDDYWRKILNCGNQSLGSRLFDGKTQWQRSDFIIDYNNFLLEERFELSEHFIAVRTSIFEYKKHKLLLAECFLPSLKQFGFK